MEKLDFDRLVGKLESNSNCVLVLGPEFINIDSSELDFTESIQDYLLKKKFNNSVEAHYFSEDGFLFSDDRDANWDILLKISKFYKDLPLSSSYEMLARIPFTSVISLSPDDLIEKAYKKIGKKATFCSYLPSGFQDGPLETSKQEPMIYNLMGHYKNEKALIFTYENLFSLLDKLFQDNVFNNARRHIIEADNFLFLGFNYNKWYLKLIFFLFSKFRGGKTDLRSNAIFNYKSKEDEFNTKIEYYKVCHKLKFSPENEKNFIEELFNACREKGILSEVNSLTAVDAESLEAKRKEKYRILFFGASPKGKMVIRTGDKVLDIEEAIKRDYYQMLKSNRQLKRGDITSEVNEKEPNLLYFNCHGNDKDELILSDPNNNPDTLPLSELKVIIRNLLVEHKQINCIVFAACKSANVAREISTLVPFCIGMNDNVYEDVSDSFTRGFFEGFIRDNQNFQYAFNMGVLGIRNCDQEKYRQFHTVPVLFANGEAIEMKQY